METTRFIQRGTLGQSTSDAISKDEVTIVLPVLNEEGAIGPVLKELFAEGYKNLMLVDGYSTDSTLSNAEIFGVEIIQQHGRGKTGAIQTALDHVKTPYLLVMDGDFTYSASDIQRMLPHARNYDQIIGARKNEENIVRSHRFGNNLITKIFNLLMGTKLSDVLSGMYLLRTEAAKSLRLDSADFTVEVEIASQMAQHGTITEVPIGYRSRVGKQKLSTWKDGPKILGAIFRLARQYNPTFLFSLAGALFALPAIGILTWVLIGQAITGVFRMEWGLAAAVLLIISTQALCVSAISLVLKRSESRLGNRISKHAIQNEPAKKEFSLTQ